MATRTAGATHPEPRCDSAGVSAGADDAVQAALHRAHRALDRSDHRSRSKVPLSESAVIAPFNGVRNYLQWLSEVSLPVLESERFVGADGTVIPPPTALLYVLLRYALLTAVEEGALGVARDAGESFFDVIERDPVVANIGRSQHVLRKDYLTVNAAPLGLSAVSTPLATGSTSLRARRSSRRFPRPLRLSPMRTTRSPPWRMFRRRGWNGCSPSTSTCARTGSMPGSPRYMPSVSKRCAACSNSLACISARMDGSSTCIRTGLPGRPSPRMPSRCRCARWQGGRCFKARTTADSCTRRRCRRRVPQRCCATRICRTRHDASRTVQRQPLVGARARRPAFIEGIRNGQSIAALLGYEFERGLHERLPVRSWMNIGTCCAIGFRSSRES